MNCVRPFTAAFFFAMLVVALPESGFAQNDGKIHPTFTARARLESWDWFDAGAAGRYDYLGATIRAGVSQQQPRFGWRAEVAMPALIGLPDDATLPGTQGQLGVGATAYASSGQKRNVVNVLPRQLWLRVGRTTSGPALTLGRFDFNDAAERTPANKTVATLRAQRIAQRLVGTFGFTHVQRSFDGAQLAFNSKGQQLIVAGMRPTPGAFAINGAAPLDMDLGYAAWSRDLHMGSSNGDVRLFSLYSNDRRDVRLVDNRPSVTRQADRGRAEVFTTGGHWLQVVPTDIGLVDVLAWGVVQRGTWGALDQQSSALALEAGIQPKGMRGKPWLRVGMFQGSGDSDALDTQHGTFYQVIPTPRAYAQFPFYNLMNNDELFVHLQIQPHAKVTAKFQAHRLQLAERADLWYLGGGAFEPRSFGFAGRPSGGSTAVANAVEATVVFQPAKRWAVEAFASVASPGAVIEAIYPNGGNGRFMFLETRFTW